MAGAALGLITQAFFDPPPFPDVRLTRTNRTTVNGRLIATENGSYYVEINGDVDVIPQLQTADVLTSSHHASATIWPALWLADHI